MPPARPAVNSRGGWRTEPVVLQLDFSPTLAEMMLSAFASPVPVAQHAAPISRRGAVMNTLPPPCSNASVGKIVELQATAAVGRSAAIVACAVMLRAVPRQRRRGGRAVAVTVPRRAGVGDTATLDRDEQKAPAVVGGRIVDEEAMLANSSFPIKPDALVQKCKEFLGRGLGGTGPDSEADLADDFEFCAPVVGPLGKEAYVEALGNFKLLEAFPDTDANYHFFRVDPFEPDRVWWQTRKTATNTGEFMNKPATGKALVFPPEAYSVRFNEAGKVKEFTVGYPMDRRVGNTGGLGGAFGYFYGVGRPLPIPECRPYKPSLQFRFLMWLGRIGKRFQGVKEQKKSP